MIECSIIHLSFPPASNCGLPKGGGVRSPHLRRGAPRKVSQEPPSLASEGGTGRTGSAAPQSAFVCCRPCNTPNHSTAGGRAARRALRETFDKRPFIRRLVATKDSNLRLSDPWSDALSIELVAGGFPCPAGRTRLRIHAADSTQRKATRTPGAGTGSAYVFKVQQPGKPFLILLTSARKAKKPSRALTLEGLMDRLRSPEALFLGYFLLTPLFKTRPAGGNRSGHAEGGGSLVSG
jgi:hypothetical protein